MVNHPFHRRAVLGLFAAALTATAASFNAAAHLPSPGHARLAQVEIIDRATHAVLPVFHHNQSYYLVGQPNHEYTIRIRNRTGARILAVTSVDGVNVISGDTAAPSQTGYVIDPWGSVEISGWRKSHSRTAAFFFTEHASSYAARTGRPFDVGVIGVAVFAEKAAPPVRISEPREKRWQQDAAGAPRLEAEAAQAPAPAAPSPAAPSRERADNFAESQAPGDASRDRLAATQPAAKLGTGHGRSETSYVRTVAFERATAEPTQLVALRYDRHENLVAMGVLPAPTPHYARRDPQPFPGVRFAPDPN